MKSEKEILFAFVEKTLGIPPDQIGPLVYKKGPDNVPTTEIDEKALDALLDKDKVRVQTIKSQVDTTSHFDNGYKKAQSEVLAAKEKAFKEKYKMEGEYKLDDLVDHIVTTKVKEASSGDIEEAKVKGHPLFIQTLKKVEDTENEWKTKLDTAIKDYTTKLEQTEVKGEAKSVVLKAFMDYKPVLSTNAERAETQKKEFVDSILQTSSLKKVAKVGIALLDENGEVRTDEHGHVVTLDKFVFAKASALYDQVVQSKKGNAGNGGEGEGGRGGNGGGGSNNGEYTMPETKAEFDKLMMNVSISSGDKQKIRKHWQSLQGGN